MNRWKEVWNKREKLDDTWLEKNEFELFCELKKKDGFDISVDEGDKAFHAFYDEILGVFDRIREYVGDFSSVYEVGCGCGVNLFLAQNHIKDFRGGGIDYSSALIETAQKIIKGSDLRCGEAIDITTDDHYDVVMSESVFQYFDSYEYAEEVLCKMIEKADKLVYIGEVCDLQYEEEQISARREKIPDYDELYKGLGRRFYSRDWFKRIAEEKGLNIVISDVKNEEYVNASYMFNIFMSK